MVHNRHNSGLLHCKIRAHSLGASCPFERREGQRVTLSGLTPRLSRSSIKALEGRAGGLEPQEAPLPTTQIS